MSPQSLYALCSDTLNLSDGPHLHTAGMSYQVWCVGSSTGTWAFPEGQALCTLSSALGYEFCILCMWDTTSHGKLGYLVPTLSKEAQNSQSALLLPSQLVQEVHRGYSCFMSSPSALSTGSHFLWYLTFAYVAKISNPNIVRDGLRSNINIYLHLQFLPEKNPQDLDWPNKL